MKAIISIVIAGLLVASLPAGAAKKKAAKVAKTATVQKAASDLKTDVKFNDSVLHGQYQVPEEALAKVENEKALGDLIGVRKHFKDRLTTAASQE